MILEAFSMPLSRHLIDEEAMVLDAFSMSLPMSSEKAEPDYSSQAKFSKAGKSKSRKETIPFAIPFDLYYPTDATSGEQAFFEPSYLPGLKHKLDGVLYGATMTQSKKCFPLVIYSHGLNSFPTDNNNLLRRLAENGFIVAAPDHINIGNLKDVIEGDATSLSNLRNGPHDRPRDVSAVLDALLANEEYSSKICRKDDGSPVVAVTGDSLGVSEFALSTPTSPSNSHTAPLFNLLGIHRLGSGLWAQLGLSIHREPWPFIPFPRRR